MPREVNPAFVRTTMPLLSCVAVTGVLDGTGAITFVTSLPIGIRCTLESMTFIFSVAATGASASQVFHVRKGNASGTAVLDATLALADGASIGAFKNWAVTAANDTAATFKDGDTLSFTRDASGTAFTAGAGQFFLTFRQRPQARA